MIVVASIGGELVDALSFAFGMLWEILWALILGFALSGAVQALVSKEEMRRLLPGGRCLRRAVSKGACDGVWIDSDTVLSWGRSFTRSSYLTTGVPGSHKPDR
jgi:hypothetical protein